MSWSNQNNDDYMDHLRQAFERMQKRGLKMNPIKPMFGVTVGNFLGFLVQVKGIKIEGNKAKAILQTCPPSNKKQLQSLLGKINFLRCFILKFV